MFRLLGVSFCKCSGNPLLLGLSRVQGFGLEGLMGYDETNIGAF